MTENDPTIAGTTPPATGDPAPAPAPAPAPPAEKPSGRAKRVTGTPDDDDDQAFAVYDLTYERFLDGVFTGPKAKADAGDLAKTAAKGSGRKADTFEVRKV